MNRGKILEAWRRKRASGALLKGGPEGPDFVTMTDIDPGSQRDPRKRAALALLPIRDSNARSLNVAASAVGKHPGTPVVADVCATDPLRLIDSHIEELRELGVAGVRNCPSMGTIDGSFRRTLEESGLGYAKEVAMIAAASKLDLLTIAAAYSPEDAKKMADAGADVVVAHPGFGPAKAVGDIVAAAREARKGILVFSVWVEAPGVDGIQID